MCKFCIPSLRSDWGSFVLDCMAFISWCNIWHILKEREKRKCTSEELSNITKTILINNLMALFACHGDVFNIMHTQKWANYYRLNSVSSVKGEYIVIIKGVQDVV